MMGHKCSYLDLLLVKTIHCRLNVGWGGGEGRWGNKGY